MRELSLFSGAGGGLLGTRLLGWRPVGYVEWNDYCQRVIAQRITDGILPAAPIFTDVREFVRSGAADQYRGFVDVVTGGFPCQPFSVAGKRAGADDARNMWPATMEVIRRVQPAWAFFENVPGLLSSGYFGAILSDLAEGGYDVGWRILSAADVGAAHLRRRLWIAAHAMRSERWPQAQSGAGDAARADAVPGGWQQGANGPGNTHAPMGVVDRRVTWWETEPELGRLADGVANRVDRLRAAGNGQVPGVAARAWQLLSGHDA